MKRLAKVLAGAGLALALVGAAHAREDDIDINRLRGSLDQLSNDPSLGHYALSEQARAREAIRTLEAAGRSGRPHALYLAERRVDLAKTAAQLQDAQVKLNQLDREHDQILLANSRREADMARLELARQRLQNQLAQEEAARLQQQGVEYSQQAEQARAEAERAKKLAAAQSKVARAARREAALAAQAAKAMRAQMDDSDTATPSSTGKDKPAGKHPGSH
jgi:chromosome segregation ATPase